MRINSALATKPTTWQWIKSLASICFFVTLAFVIVYRKWTFETWLYPIAYKADNLAVLFFTSMYAKGEILPLASKVVSFMNAPFGANFNDLPGNESILYWFIGQFQRIFGLFLGSNLALVFTMILNAISFYIFLLYFGIRNCLATAGAIIVGISHFFLLRGFEHIMLTEAWHIPPMLIVAHWTFGPLTEWTRGQKNFARGVAVFTGFFFVYYAFLLVQLVSLGGLRHLMEKKWSRVWWVGQLILLSAIGLVCSEIATIANRVKYGPNNQIITRYLAEVELYSLKISDLFLPFTHIIPKLERWTHAMYFDRPFLIHTEAGYSYLGIIGIVAFVYAVSRPLIAYFKNQKVKHEDFVIFIYWILLYSVSGGINFLISAVSGLYVFRCTNRYSIILLMLSMALLLKRMNPKFGRNVALLLIAVSLLDLPGRLNYNGYAEIKTRVDSDRQFVSQVEKTLPKGARIFQLPVMDYPENPKIYNMTDYEHFRPALYTSSYNWSYGAVRGRPDNDWQKELEKKPAAEMIEILKGKGFQAVYLNKRGFADGGQKLIADISGSLPKTEIVSSDDLILFKIQ